MTTDMRDDGPDDAFADPALAGLLAELRAVADQPAPAAGAELTALLAGAAPITPARARRSRTASAVVIGLVSSGVLAGGVGAAAADQLPAPVQRVVSRVVDTLTPFEVPHPDQRVPARHERDDDPPLPQAPADLDDTDDTDVSPPGTPGAPDPSRPDDPKQSRDTEESERPEEAEEADVSGDSDSGEGEDDSTAERDDRTEDRSGERDGDASEDDERSGDSSGDSSDDSGGAGDDSEDHRD